jgi:hypothetical protein
MAYNAISHEIRDQHSEIISHHEASKMEASAEYHNNTTNMMGVTSYVEKAAEEDNKAKLIMEINDLKQLLGGRKAQVASLSAENANLQQKVNQLQELEHKCSNLKTRHPGPGSVSCSFPTSIPTQIVGKGEQDQIVVKVVEEMQLDALKLEAMARGMDTATVIPMTKDTLLNKLVIGTTCISKSTVWSNVVGLRCSIENEKAAICAREGENQQQLDTAETKCAPTRKKKRAHCEDSHGQYLGRSRDTVTNADTNTRFTRSSLEANKAATHVTCQSQFQSKVPPPPPPAAPHPQKCLRNDGKVKFNTSPNGVSVFNNNATTTQDQDIPISSVSCPSLADKDDEKNTHPSHAIIRRDILEAFVTVVAPKFKEEEGEIPIRSKRKLTRQQRHIGFVGFRCRYCKDKPINKQADLAAIFPESISGIYRANIRFKRKHIEACPYIPKQLKDKLNRLNLKTYKNSNRGKKAYWTQSAIQKGFRDWRSPAGRNGIIYCPGPEVK